MSHFGGTTAGNVILGGVVGLGVDAASGANYHYDSPLRVALTNSGKPGEIAPLSSDIGDHPPRLDHNYPNPQPRYPDAAQFNGEVGDVELEVLVLSSGRVRSAKVVKSSGFDDLDNAAVEGVLNWRFVPATDGGNYTTDRTRITISFRPPPTAVPVPPSSSSGAPLGR